MWKKHVSENQRRKKFLFISFLLLQSPSLHLTEDYSRVLKFFRVNFFQYLFTFSFILYHFLYIWTQFFVFLLPDGIFNLFSFLVVICWFPYIPKQLSHLAVSLPLSDSLTFQAILTTSSFLFWLEVYVWLCMFVSLLL